MNENFKLVYENQVLLDYTKLCEKIAHFINVYENKATQIELFIEEIEDFLVAFFGLLALKKEPILLQNGEFKNEFIDKKLFDTFMQKPNLQNKIFDFANLDENSIFYIKTSGSSGEPKNVLKTLSQMIKEAQILQKTFEVQSDDIFLSCVSHQHLYGLTFKIFLPLLSGASVEKQDFYLPNLLTRQSVKSFIFIASPVVLRLIANYGDLSGILKAKRIFLAGGMLDENTKEILKSCPLIEIYGGSEMGVVAFRKERFFTPFEGVNLNLDSQNRLIIHSPWQENFKDKNAFLSADCANLNDNKLELLGRYDRIIKLFEKRISLDFVENTLKKHEFISDCKVFKDENQTRLSTLITLTQKGKECFRKNGKLAITRALKSYLYADFKSSIRYFYIRENLPYNASGKLSQKACVESARHRFEPKFSLVAQGENEVKLQAYISESCFYFDGHFSNFPLVPGFCELKFVLENARIYLNVKNFIEIENVKFLHFLRVFDTCTLKFSLKNEKLYFELFANEKKCCTGRAKCSFKGQL